MYSTYPIKYIKNKIHHKMFRPLSEINCSEKKNNVRENAYGIKALIIFILFPCDINV